MRYSKTHFWALVVSLLLWGFSFPALKVALVHNSPITILVYRYGFAFLVLLPFFFRRRKEASALASNKMLFILGVSNWAGSILQFAGLQLTSASKSAVLSQMTMVVVPILAFFVLAERLDWTKGAAILLSMMGGFALSTNLNLAGLGTGLSLKGDGLTVAAVFFWAVFVVYTRRFAQRVDLFWMLWANTSATFALSAVTAIAAHRLAIDWTGLWISFLLAVLCTLLPTILYNYSLKVVDATASAILGPLEAVSAVFVSMLVLHEAFRPAEIAGALLIVASAYLVDLPIYRRKNQEVRGKK
jgi:drug/metabolite transporter (DMT)-like permease